MCVEMTLTCHLIEQLCLRPHQRIVCLFVVFRKASWVTRGLCVTSITQCGRITACPRPPSRSFSSWELWEITSTGCRARALLWSTAGTPLNPDYLVSYAPHYCVGHWEKTAVFFTLSTPLYISVRRMFPWTERSSSFMHFTARSKAMEGMTDEMIGLEM